MYAYGDVSGMKKLRPKSCKTLNASLRRRLVAFFKIIRDNHPKHLIFHFGVAGNLGEQHDDIANEGVIGNSVSIDELDDIFTAEDYDNVNDPEKLKLLHQLAKTISEETYTEADCSVAQLENNLVSIIGQKAAEMNLMASLAIRNPEELTRYYSTIFNNNGSKIELDIEDIKESAESIRRSPKIFMALREGDEFEKSFIKCKSKILKSFFMSSKVNISSIEKVMIFTLNYITKRKSQSKHVKQFLKKNASFRAFEVSVDVVLQKPTELGVLTTEVRIKRARLNEIGRGINEVKRAERRETFFKILYDSENLQQKHFLDMYQIIYPGERFGE